MDCGKSAILPNGTCAFLPSAPTDGQVYIDQTNVKWIFSTSSDLWERAGTATTVPLVSANNAGFLSSRDKSLLDKVLAVPGGFGIVTDTKLLLQNDNNPDGVIRGNIELKSDSLDIVCVTSDGIKASCELADVSACATADARYPGLTFKLSDKLLSSLVVNFPGARGKRGVKGEKGYTGKPGFAGGPKGLRGLPGDDVATGADLAAVTYNDLNGISESAIVKLEAEIGRAHV